MNRTRTCLLLSVLFVSSVAVWGQQLPDPEFNVSVANPAYNKNGPRVLFDEGHHNFHTSEGRYKPFVDLLMNDGDRIIRIRQPFTKSSLSGFKVLVIANALGAEEMDDNGADGSAFTEEECAAVQEWVKGGGSLLLIADHAPFGGAAAALGNRFGVDMSKGFTYDPANSVKNNASLLIFSDLGQVVVWEVERANSPDGSWWLHRPAPSARAAARRPRGHRSGAVV